jgi:oligoribonuclease NrnB/cAMP/cGMP phosphodiesterase (DHH superfamily)
MIDKKALVIFHRVDFDGLLSAAITLDALKRNDIEAEYLGWNYGDELPDFERICNDYTDLVMVDISFPADIMLRLGGTDRNITWIDHHITAIENSYQEGYSGLPGIRRNGTAACELCWEYFYPTCPVPRVIEYLGYYDVWNKTRYSWDNQVLPFQYGLKTRYGVNPKTFFPVFEDLLYEVIDLDEIIHEGDIILKYLERTWKSACKTYSFEIRVAGKYKGICILTTEFTSNIFNSVAEEYDVVVCCNRKGPDTYNLGMYKDQNKCPEFNCGEYMKNYGGGGHKGSSGGTLSFEEFKKLITDCEI